MSTLRPLTLLALLCGVSLAAADGRIPIASIPAVLNTSGTYYLTKDLSGNSSILITVTAPSVTIDFAGHTLAHTGSGTAVSVNATVTRFEMRDGVISGGASGLVMAVAGTSTVRVEGMLFNGQTLQGLRFFGNSNSDLFLARILRNTINMAGTACSSAISQISSRFSGQIAENTVRGCQNSGAPTSAHGINFGFFRGGEISRNLIEENGGDGLLVNAGYGFSVDDNILSSNGSAAVRLLGTTNSIYYTGNRLYNNGAGIVESVSNNVSGGGNCDPNAGAGTCS